MDDAAASFSSERRAGLAPAQSKGPDEVKKTLSGPLLCPGLFCPDLLQCGILRPTPTPRSSLNPMHRNGQWAPQGRACLSQVVTEELWC